MSGILYPPTRPLSIGGVVDSAFRIFRTTLLRCLPMGVLAMVAGQLQNIFDILTHRPLHRFGRGDPIWWILYVLGIFLAYTFINAILVRQVALASGQPASAHIAFVAGLRKSPASLAVLLLIGLCCGVLLLPVIFLPPALRNAGLLVMGVPAVYVGVLLSCSWTALLIGRKGIVESLLHSAHLIRGNWWRTVTIYLVAWAMLGVLFVSAGILAAVLIPFAAGSDVAVATAASAVMVVALGAVYVPLFTAVWLVLYADLEARKDGADLQRRVAAVAAG